MSQNNDKLVVEYIDNGNFRLIKDFNFYFSDNSFITIPKGFKTDFGSVPQIFQSIVSPVGKPTEAYVLHDYLCVRAIKGEIPRKEADLKFKEALKVLKVNKVKIYIIYFWVRIYGILKEKLLKKD